MAQLPCLAAAMTLNEKANRSERKKNNCAWLGDGCHTKPDILGLARREVEILEGGLQCETEKAPRTSS